MKIYLKIEDKFELKINLKDEMYLKDEMCLE